MSLIDKVLGRTDLKLGDSVRDSISGYEGVITGRFEYLNGCVRYAVTAHKVNTNNEVQETVFDEGRLVNKTAKEQVEEGQVRRTGGPMDTPTRNDPTR